MGVVILAVWTFYLLPVLIAHRRRHPAGWPVFLVTLLLGWTLFGWFFALGMAFSEPRRPTT